MWSATFHTHNRLVADTLEALWNDKLRQLEPQTHVSKKRASPFLRRLPD
jgi:hypothetical protein